MTPEFASRVARATYFGAYDISTQQNVDQTMRMTGVDMNYKQALTFLPHWARGVQVFANATAIRATGPAIARRSTRNSAAAQLGASWTFGTKGTF